VLCQIAPVNTHGAFARVLVVTPLFDVSVLGCPMTMSAHGPDIRHNLQRKNTVCLNVQRTMKKQKDLNQPV
jgi:hypothetical protein